MEYNYPLDYEWTNDEMVVVISFFNQVEAFYEKGVQRDTLKTAYEAFKKIVPSQSEEKQLFKVFAKESGYESYTAVKAMRDQTDATYLQANN